MLIWIPSTITTLKLRQNGQHFAHNIFKGIFFNENIWISINISLTFVLKGQINNILVVNGLVLTRDKPSSEIMMVSLLMHVCLGINELIYIAAYYRHASMYTHTKPSLHYNFNSLWLNDTIWGHKSGSTLAQAMACCLTAPNHYLNQCWLIIRKVQRHPSESNFTRDTSAINHWN